MTKEENYVVYMHKNIINGKIYIGITSQNVKCRWRDGKGYKTGIFHNAIKKYGWDNFEHIILFENLSKQEACKKEIELILKYNSKAPNGYNAANGGECGSKGSHWKMTDEQREKDRINHLGTKNGMYGIRGDKHPCFKKKVSEETKQKIRIKKLGSIPWNKGKNMTDEQKKIISKNVKIAMQNPNIKIKLHKPKKINKNNWKKVICIETNEIFESTTLAAENKKCKNSDISRVCKGKRKTCKGYHWKYYEE